MPARTGAAFAAAADGTAFLFGGRKFNTSTAVTESFRMTTDGIAADTVAPQVRMSNLSGSIGKLQVAVIKLYFEEDIFLFQQQLTEAVPVVEIKLSGSTTVFQIPVDNSKTTSPATAGSTGGGSVSVEGA